MALLGRVAEGRRRKLEEFLSKNLQPGETLQATLSMTETNNPAFLGILFTKFFGIGLTNERLYFVEWAKAVPERPQRVLGSVSRDAVKIGKWKRGLPLAQGT